AYKKYLELAPQHAEQQKLNQKTKETLLDLKIPATREERLIYYKQLKKELNLIFFRDELKEITQKPLSDLEYMLAELEIIKLIIQETGVAKEIPQDLRDYTDNKNLTEPQRIHIQRLLT